MEEQALNQELEAQQEPSQTQEPAVESSVDPEVERRARTMGWIPKEDFRGDISKWRSASDYVSRAEELMPILRAQNKKYEDKIYALENDLKTSKSTMDKILKMSDNVAQREYERARSEIIKAQASAVGEGNMQRWQELELEKDKLEKPEKIAPYEPSQPQRPEDNPQFKEWHRDNNWYLGDSDMTLYANAYAQANQNPNIPYITWLDTVKEAVKRAFPHKFTNPARSKPSSVDGGSSSSAGPGRPKNKTYNDLPADAKLHCDRFVEQKLFKSREDYVKEYFSEE